MLYDQDNARGASVYDVERREALSKVFAVNTDTGTVSMYSEPLRINAQGEEVETFEAHFETIYPIFGGHATPVLFHCYGRQA